MNQTKIKEIINCHKPKPFHKFCDTIDYLLAYILQNRPDIDILTAEKFINLIKTHFYYQWWKENEFEWYMLKILDEIYEKIDPIKDNFKLFEKYNDLTSTINDTISSDGNMQECGNPPSSSDYKKYIATILTQTANYGKNDTTTNAMNRSLLDDIKKMIDLPQVNKLLDNAVNLLQPYAYNKDKVCNCGKCGHCRKQKFNTNEAYYVDLKRQLNELCNRMGYYESKKRGPIGPVGEKGDQGIQGEKGEQGIQGETGKKGDTITDVGVIEVQDTPEGKISFLEQTLSSGKEIRSNEFLIPRGLKGDTGERGPIGPPGENPFTPQEIQRLKAMLNYTTYGYNSVGQFVFKGFKTQFIIYKEFGVPDDNIVTDTSGKELDGIVRKFNAHYAQTFIYNDKGEAVLEEYQNKLTYKGNEVATTNLLQYWKEVGSKDSTNPWRWNYEWKKGYRYRINASLYSKVDTQSDKVLTIEFYHHLQITSGNSLIWNTKFGSTDNLSTQISVFNDRLDVYNTSSLTNDNVFILNVEELQNQYIPMFEIQPAKLVKDLEEEN